MPLCKAGFIGHNVRNCEYFLEPLPPVWSRRTEGVASVVLILGLAIVDSGGERVSAAFLSTELHYLFQYTLLLF